MRKKKSGKTENRQGKEDIRDNTRQERRQGKEQTRDNTRQDRRQDKATLTVTLTVTAALTLTRDKRDKTRKKIRASQDKIRGKNKPRGKTSQEIGQDKR